MTGPRRRPGAALLAVAVAIAALPPLLVADEAEALTGQITTVAGTGSFGYSGDAGPATEAQLDSPIDVAVGADGILYIADTWNHRVRRVDAAGTITTYAGTGTAGFSGDNGPATSADIHAPRGMALDGAGNLYISTPASRRVRKIDTSGTITTVAGNGNTGSSGDGGPATSARLTFPRGLAVDASGNLYIADSSVDRVRKVDTSGTITTVAGTGSAGYSGDGGAATSAQLNAPGDVAIDSVGNLYIADALNNRVRKVDTSGTITTVAGNGTQGADGDGGPATSASLNRPYDLTLDGADDLFVGDTFNHRIREVSAGVITPVAGTTNASGSSGDGGPALAAEFFYPNGMAFDTAGDLYLADDFNFRIRVIEGVGAPAPGEPHRVVLDPPAQSHDVGEEALVTATVTDAAGAPVSGEVVTFTRTGTHPGGEAATTDASGEATHIWSGTQEGADVVRASVKGPANLVGGAQVTWKPNDASATAVVFDPAVVTGEQGDELTLELSALDDEGAPFVGTVAFGAAPAGDEPSFDDTVTTDSQGRGWLSVIPSAEHPAWQVFAYADRDDAGTSGAADPGEVPGAAVAIGTPPPTPNAPPATPILVAPAPGVALSAIDPQFFALSSTDPNGDPYTGRVTVRDDTDDVVVSFDTAPSPSGQDATGTPVPPLSPGDYTWSARAADVHGAESDSAEPRAFSVVEPPANEAPSTPVLVAPEDGSTFESTEAVTFSIRADDPEDGPYRGSVTVRREGSGTVVASFETAPAPSGEDSSGTPVTPLGTGSYTWSAVALDAEGAQSAESAPASFTISDNDAPGVPTLIAPEEDHAFSATEPQVFTIRSTDPEQDPYLGTVTVRDDAGEVVTTFETAAAPSGQDSSGSALPPLPPGDYTYSATASDPKGAQSPPSESRAFSIEPLPTNRPPEAPTLIAPPIAYVGDPPSTVNFTIRTEDPDDDPYTGTATVRDDTGEVVRTFETAPARSGESSSGRPVPPLAAGSYSWTATATDVHGAESPDSIEKAFVVGGAPPGSPTLAAPPDGAEWGVDDPQAFTIRTVDPDGDAYTGIVEVWDAADEVVASLETAPTPSGEDATAVSLPALEPGEYTWSATATDVGGAEGPESETFELTVLGDQAPTVPVLVEPDHDHRFSLTDPQRFAVSANDPEEGPFTATITVREADTGDVAAGFSTPVTLSGEDAPGVPVPPLAEGDYTWSATAADAAGHTSEASPARAFSVGNAAPLVPTLVSPRPGETLSTEGPQRFAVSTTDADGDAYTTTITVRYAAGGGVVTSFAATPAASGEDAVATPGVPLAVGNYTWEAKASDTHADESPVTQRRAFSVSANRPPGAPILLAPADGADLYVEDPPVFTVSAEDPEGAPYTATITLTNTDIWSTQQFDTTVASSGQQSSGTPYGPLLPGNYQWYATARDAFGLAGLDSVTHKFTLTVSPSPPPAAQPAAGPITRASISTTGEEADWWSSNTPSISADGRYVAFSSGADNLVEGDSNFREDIFVHDRVAGTTDRVSLSSGIFTTGVLPVQSNQYSENPVISGDGRYVAFESYATNLVSGDTNGWTDIFVHDRVRKVTERVSVKSSGAQVDGSSFDPAISTDGRYVAFSSWAEDVVSGDTNGAPDVFVRDRVAGTTHRVSLTNSGGQAACCSFSEAPSISADGRYVAFQSTADNLVSGDTNWSNDVFVRDRAAGTTKRVSVSSSGAQGNSTSSWPSITPDGKHVVFDSIASNLVSGDTNGKWDVFVRDLTTNTTRRVSVSSGGKQANAFAHSGSISADGRHVVFQSEATNLVAGDRNGSFDVFHHDRLTGKTTLVSHDGDGLQASNDSQDPVISADGLHVAFSSWASNLVPRDFNGSKDIFAYNRQLSLECAGGSLSVVGCLSGYGFKAASSKVGLEDFYPYHPFDLGSETAFLNVATGNQVVQANDLEVPGQGLNLRLTRTYNSHCASCLGPLGRGWRLGIAGGEADDLLTSVVSAALSADVGQLVEVIATEDQFDFFDADGTRHHFVKGGLAGPGWHSPPGVDLTLSDFVVGTERRYRVTRPDGVAYEFRPVAGAYALRSIADRKGNSLSFTYASSGALSSVADTEGRTFTFTWSGDFLDKVTYSGSGSTYVVDYTVDPWFAELTSVSAGGRTTGYDYSWGVSEVTDAKGNTTEFDFNQSAMVTGVTDRSGKDWTVEYNTATCQPGNEEAVVATCVTDPEGSTTTYTSSAQANLLSVRDAGDQKPNTREYLWEGNRLVWESDEAGNTTEYAYNRNGQVVFTRQSGGEEAALTSVFTYRDVAPGVADMVSARVGAGSHDERVWSFGLDEAGNLVSTTDPEGAVTSFSHYERGLLESVTDPNGHTTTYGNTSLADGGYHPSGQPPSITDATGKTMSFTYDFLGRLTSRVDRNGSTWSFAYDTRGNLTSQASPVSGSATTFAYDLNDNQTSVTPPGGATTTNTYDASDRLTATQATVSGTLRKTTYHYDDAGKLVEIREPRTYAGSPTVTQKVTFDHYLNGRVSAMTDEEGKTTAVTYTPEGHLRTVTEPEGSSTRHATTYTYNRRGQVTSVLESGHSKPTRHAYSEHGERLWTTSPKGVTTTFEYDDLGRLRATTDPQKLVSTRVYDRAGNLVRVTQPAGRGSRITTSYAHTPRGEIAWESDPADGAHRITYQYDDEGRQRFRRDRYGSAVERTIEQTFRSDGAITERLATAPDRPSHRSTYTYDPAGNVTAANAFLDGASVSALSVTYNTAFEPTSVAETIHPPSGPAVTKTTTYAYQPDGLLASRTIDNKTTTYTHTKHGLEATATPWGSLGSFTHAYLDNGALRRTTLPNGSVIDHAYDPAERLASRTLTDSAGTTLSAWSAIAYDDDDHRTAETVTQVQPEAGVAPKAGKATYSYDPSGRLTSAKHPFDAKTATYELDDAGNVTRESAASLEATYAYVKNRLTRRTLERSETESGVTLTATERSRYSHDRLGDLTREQLTRTLRIGVSGASGTDTQSAIRTTSYDAASHTRRVEDGESPSVDYAYDALDRLVRRHEDPPSGPDVVTLFFHEGASEQVALETNASGDVETRYPLDSTGYPLGQEGASSSDRASFIQDPRGNLAQVLDAGENVRAVFSYDAFGKERDEHTEAASGWDARLRFQMAPRDPATGAYALGPRLYDPEMNRFVGSDFYAGAAANLQLALDPLTGNRYLYAGANPVGLIDDGHGPGCGRLGPKSSQAWKQCKNTWVPYRDANAARIGCGECPEMYAAFNNAHPEFGLSKGVANIPAAKENGGVRKAVCKNVVVSFVIDWGSLGGFIRGAREFVRSLVSSGGPAVAKEFLRRRNYVVTAKFVGRSSAVATIAGTVGDAACNLQVKSTGRSVPSAQYLLGRRTYCPQGYAPSPNGTC